MKNDEAAIQEGMKSRGTSSPVAPPCNVAD